MTILIQPAMAYKPLSRKTPKNLRVAWRRHEVGPEAAQALRAGLAIAEPERVRELRLCVHTAVAIPMSSAYVDRVNVTGIPRCELNPRWRA